MSSQSTIRTFADVVQVPSRVCVLIHTDKIVCIPTMFEVAKVWSHDLLDAICLAAMLSLIL